MVEGGRIFGVVFPYYIYIFGGRSIPYLVHSIDHAYTL